MSKKAPPGGAADPKRSGLNVVWKFKDGAEYRVPLEDHIEEQKRQMLELGRVMAEREGKEARAEAFRATKEAQRLENLARVEAAFLALPESLRGRSATSLVCKATGLKADAVRDHLTEIRKRMKTG